MLEKKDLVIIGGGAGGLNVASATAQLGLNVMLIEKQNVLGGDCLHYGCVPSKTLINSAKVAYHMAHADEVGLESVKPKVDLSKVNQRVKSVIEQIQVHDDPQRFRDYGCEVLFGDASFIDPYIIQIEDRKIESKRFVIATGSKPAIPPIPGLEETGYITNETVFDLQRLPERLIILGAGFIGLELAQAFSRLGSEVILIDMLDRLLPQVDADVAALLQQALEKEGIKFYLESRVEKVSFYQDEKVIELYDDKQDLIILTADELLVATGRQANVSDLGLEKLDIKFSNRGISVDQKLRTKQKHIYAMGDVIDGPYKLTHMAEYHAGIIISNAVFHFPKKVSHRTIPSVMYTDPELAMVGMTEEQAMSQGITPEVLQVKFKDIDRALTDNSTDGKVKILVHKNRIIGATLLGPHAGEIIAEIVLAMEAKLKISSLSAAVHAYPTLAQINRRTINSYYGKKLFSPKVKKVVKWLNRFF